MSAAYPSCEPALEKISARIAVSEDARRTLVEHLGGDAVLIPNGVVRRPVRAPPSRAPEWRGAGGTLGFIGRLDEPRKGLPILLAALPSVVADAARACGCWSPAAATSRRPSRTSPAEVRARGDVPRPGRARRTRRGCCARSTSTSPRTPAARASASSWSRRWRPGRRCSPATSTRSAGCSTTAGSGVHVPDRRHGGAGRGAAASCSTTRRGGPRCRRPPRPGSAATTGRPSATSCWRSTRRSPPAPAGRRGLGPALAGPAAPMRTLVVIAVLLVLVGWYLTFSATRLDRLHARLEGARSALDAQLVRRASVSLQIAVSGRARPGQRAAARRRRARGAGGRAAPTASRPRAT